MRDHVWRRLSWRRRLAFHLARLFPARWRFAIFGLPATALSPVDSPHDHPGMDISRIVDGTACHQGAHLDAGQKIVPALSPGANGPIEERFVLRQQFFPRTRRVDGVVASLAMDGDVNYFHWLVETLPRWKCLGPDLARLSGVYVCQKHPFHRDALRLLGVREELIFDSATIPYLRADEVLVPRYLRRSEKWIVPWLRENFATPPTVATKSNPRRIYISRRAATSRGVANEAELLSLFHEFQIAPVRLEELPWLEQIALLQRADVVIGAHGAGLANLAFCRSRALAIELTPEGLNGPFYEEIGAALDLDYHTVRCVSVGRGDLHSLPMNAPVATVREILRARLAQK